MTERRKTQVEDVSRGVYDIKNEVHYRLKTKKGLTKEIVNQISDEKNEPDWMRELRLDSLEKFYQIDNPIWGPDLSEVNIGDITTYISPDANLTEDWDEVPDDIRNTFMLLGIPEAEQKKNLSGVGAQYDSEVVYHNIQKELSEQGVIYTDFETAVKEYEDIVRDYFMTCIPNTDQKYAALHGAVWSGGSFVYVPKGVKVTVPLQSYFRLNAPGAGQFEHTLIIVEEGAYCHFIEGCSAPRYNVVNIHAGSVELFIKKNATLRYSTIENWSRNMYNLNTKRAIVEEGGAIEWVSGSFGSKVSMLYPMSILIGEGARSEFTGITFAGKDQYLDTGTKVIHAAPNTSSMVNSKSISKDGGVAIYRGLVKVYPNATGSKSSVSCESLMLDSKSRSDTIPVVDIGTDDVDLGHEAKIGRIDDEVVFYLMSRGISEQEAKSMIVQGFANPIAKELPLEYAVEMNQLINLELEGTIG
ncbi:MAG: Fe-S cluster assembly protein SufB [Filifactor alocis]|uniref:Fe-S cluster assembly protein SufB n=1 Tax=Filifactor alocis TaxID=143361 RepID=UPI003FA17D4D